MCLLKKIFIIALVSFSPHCYSRKAFVIVPVADLVGEPITTFGLAKTNKESYEKIALCDTPGTSSTGTPRIHQLLFNETVDIIHEEAPITGDDQEVCITFEGAFFITKKTNRPQNIFWTRKKNLLSFDKLQRKKLSMNAIPATPSFKNAKNHDSLPTVALTKPFFDPATKQTYSAGTRFIYMPEQSTDTHYAITIFDRNITQFKTSMLPTSYAHIMKNQAPAQSISCFVTLLRSWIQPSRIIPYVWGGCSYTTRVPHEEYRTSTKTGNQKKISVYERSHCKSTPHTGFDCAGIILRAAQLCGIPYFFKNTYTLAHYLQPIQATDALHEGDLIWIPGHVMIISDLHHNKLIEARGYSHEFGYAQEIELRKVFQNIATYQQLKHACLHQKPLIRLNKSGEPVETIKQCKLLKLSSAWNYSYF